MRWRIAEFRRRIAGAYEYLRTGRVEESFDYESYPHHELSHLLMGPAGIDHGRDNLRRLRDDLVEHGMQGYPTYRRVVQLLEEQGIFE